MVSCPAHRRIACLLTGGFLAVALSSPSLAAPIRLTNGTATFSQLLNGGPFSPAQAVDGDFGDPNGWALGTTETFGGAAGGIAVWETETDLADGDFEITMHFLHFNPGHLLGRFRFSVTSDDRATYADGLASGGDVEANWFVLTQLVVAGPSSMTFSTLNDGSILAGGSIPSQGIYTIGFSTPFEGITGFRLEAIEDASLPGGDGPGLHIANGNFLLTEIELGRAVIPEPSTALLLLLGLTGLNRFARRTQQLAPSGDGERESD